MNQVPKQITFIEQSAILQQTELDFGLSDSQPKKHEKEKMEVEQNLEEVETQRNPMNVQENLNSAGEQNEGKGGAINSSRNSGVSESVNSSPKKNASESIVSEEETSSLSEEDLGDIDSAVDSEIEREQTKRLQEILGRLTSNIADTRDHRLVGDMVKSPRSTQESDDEPELLEGFFLVPVLTLTDVVKCRKPTEQKVLVYENKSLFIFDHRTAFRQFLVKLTHHPIFENLVIFAIGINSLLLAIYDYKDRDNVTAYNKNCEMVSNGLTIFFTCEFVLKILAMGFVVHRNSYLRDYWNWLDTLVVIVGFIELMPFMNVASLRSLRVLRVLRPLRSINAFPNLKKQINTLLNSVTELLSAVLFMFFIFFLFGILGVQQFEGTMYQRCRLTEFPTSNDTWPYDESITTLCRKPQNGETQCPEGTWCKNPLDGGLPITVDDVIDMDSIDYGLTNFDHLGWAMLTIFQMMTVEGWTKIMYNLMDSNIQWMSVMFSISLVLITYFYAFNILLAILQESNENQGKLLESKELDQKTQQVKKLNKSISRASKQNGILQNDKEGQDKMQKVSLTRPIDQPFDEQEIFLNEIKKPSGLCCFRKRKSDEQPSPIDDSLLTERLKDLQNREKALAEPGISVDDIDKSAGPSNKIENAVQTLIPDKSITILHDNQNGEIPIEYQQEQTIEILDQQNPGATKAVKNLKQFQQNSQIADSQKQARPQLVDIREEQKEKKGRYQSSKEDSKSKQSSNENLEKESSEKEPMEFMNIDVDPIKDNQLETTESAQIGKTLIPERAQKNKVYLFFYHICSSPLFTIFIILMIIWNTIVLASDSYPADKQYEETAAILNTFFTYTFLAEMIIKLIGLGPQTYARDNFNLFDAAIVIVSLVEVAIEELGLSSGSQGGGAFSAFRSIRLLRTFKIVKSWKKFQELLTKIISALANLKYFLVLLILNMIIFTLTGMQLFGYLMKTNIHDDIIKEPFDPLDTKTIFSPRPNFDGFFNGFISIFIIFIGEDWQVSMHEHYRGLGLLPIFFFPIVYISLCMVMFNLFLAILIESFIMGDHTKENDSDDTTLSKIDRVKERFVSWWSKTCNFMTKPQKNSKIDIDEVEQSQENNLSPIKIDSGEGSVGKLNDSQQRKLLGSTEKKPRARHSRTFGQLMFRKSNSIDEESEDLSDSDSSPKPVALMRLDRIGEQERVAKRAQTLGTKFKKSVTKVSTPTSKSQQQAKQRRKTIKMATESNDNLSSPEKKNEQQQTESQKKRFSMTEQKLREQERLKQSKLSQKNIIVEGNSLGMFSPKNKLRQICHKIVSWHPNERFNYDNTVLLLIGISTVLLTLDNPLKDQNSTEAKILKYIDYVMTVIFTLECAINIILFGLYFNGPESYLRNSWNKMDAFIVVSAIVSVAMEGTGLSLNYLKVFRMLRVLRPLRVLKRNPGMKIQVLSLINGASSYGNLMLITMLVLVLFGIQGVTFFKGKFYNCSTDNLPEEVLANIHNMWDCFDVGGEWVRFNANFDDIGNAVITIFNLMTTEGWIDVMWKAVDTTEIYSVPIRNASPMNVIFFMLFLLVGSMILLNAFVGVLIMNFQDEKLKIYKEDRLTLLQHSYCEICIKSYQAQPKKEKQKLDNACRDFCLSIAKSKKFKNFITLCIVLNTICLALSWLGQPLSWKFVLGIFNYIFTAIYTIEFLIKIIALKAAYFEKGWNVFDFSIVVSAAAGIALDIIFQVDIGFATTIIRSFRIARILKIAKRLKQLRQIVQAFVVAIPELANVGGLLILFIYLYSVLGVFLFSHVKLSDNLNEHANFQQFPTAALTLFRIVTGEGWHDIMFDCARQESIFWSCTEDQTFQEQQNDGIQGCGDKFFSYLFFISYMLIVSFIFLNLFIAIILEGYSIAQKENDLARYNDSIKLFQNIWRKYDKKATGFIPINDLKNLIMHILIEELKDLEERKDEEDPVAFFGLHKEKVASVYTKWKVIEGELEDVDEETKKLIQKAAEESAPDLIHPDFKYNANRHRFLERHMRKFIGYLEIPTYNQVSHYNFHDTLECLIKMMFQDQLEMRNKKFEEKNKMGELIVPGDKEFLKLPLNSQEQIHEDMTNDFNLVLERLDEKEQEKIQLLTKVAESKNKAEADKTKNNDLDIYRNEKKDELYIIDSSQVMGAQVILAYIKKRKEKILEAKRKITMARRKTLMLDQADIPGALAYHKKKTFKHGIVREPSMKLAKQPSIKLNKQLSMKNDRQRNSEIVQMPGPRLKFRNYAEEELKDQRLFPAKPKTETLPAIPDTQILQQPKTIQLAEKITKVEEIKQIQKKETEKVESPSNQDSKKEERRDSQVENRDQKQQQEPSFSPKQNEKIIVPKPEPQVVSLPQISQKSKKEEIHQVEIYDQPDQKNKEIEEKPQIHVKVVSESPIRDQILSEDDKEDKNGKQKRDEQQITSIISLKEDLSVPSENKQSQKESNSDCKRGKSSEIVSRKMSSTELQQKSGSTSTEQKKEQNSKDQKDILLISNLVQKSFAEPSQNRDNKSPRRSIEESQIFGKFGKKETNGNTGNTGKKQREISVHESETSIDEQDDDAGGGVPAKGPESRGHFSISSDKGISVEDQRKKFIVTEQFLAIGTEEGFGKIVEQERATTSVSPHSVNRGTNFARSPKEIHDFRQSIRAQLVKGMVTSPNSKQDRKVIQNKLQKMKQSTKEIISGSQPSIQAIMHHNIHRLSTHTVSGVNQKKLSVPVKLRLRKNETNLQKWNFQLNDPNMQRLNSANEVQPNSSRRVKSIEPNPTPQYRTPYAKKQPNIVGRDSSYSMKPMNSQVVTKAKLDKIEMLKSLYDQK